MSTEDGYLPPGERKKRAEEKRDKLRQDRLTPDWFPRQDDLCLPPGGLNVAVIGGGLAGLAAAWYLSECGVATTLYEARPQVGGRVLTDRSFAAPNYFEAGAELIGENHGLWKILADKFRLELAPMSEEDSYPDLESQLRFGSHSFDKPERERLENEVRDTWIKIGNEAEPISETAPWQTPKAAELDALSITRKLDELVGPSSSHLRRWFEFTLGNDNCLPVGEQSYLGLLASVSAARMGDGLGMLGYWKSTETERCKGGNQLLADRLGDEVAAKIRCAVRPSTMVRSIEVRKPPSFPPVTVQSVSAPPARITGLPRTDGYHYAILAAPPAVWNAIRFDVDFEADRRRLDEGKAVKFFDRSDAPFWTDAESKLSPLARWDEIGSVWEGTDKQDQPRRSPFVLTTFSGGEFVLRDVASYSKRLNELFPTRIKHPNAGRLVAWHEVEHIRTGYAVPAVGQVSTIFPAQLRPHRGRLYFAGEQTSPGFFGYMEGALQSGARAARDLVQSAAVPCRRSGRS